jgi:hypothetical protein
LKTSVGDTVKIPRGIGHHWTGKYFDKLYITCKGYWRKKRCECGGKLELTERGNPGWMYSRNNEVLVFKCRKCEREHEVYALKDGGYADGGLDV